MRRRSWQAITQMQTRRCAQPLSTPEAARLARSARTRRGVDGGEHSATIDRVMAARLTRVTALVKMVA